MKQLELFCCFHNNVLRLVGAMFKRIIQPLREFGFFAGLLYAFDRILVMRKSSCRLFFYELMVQPVSTKPIAPGGLTKSLEIREIEAGDSEFSSMPTPPEILDFRQKQKAVCLGAFQNRKLIAYQWFCFGPYMEDEVRCEFVPLPEKQAVFDFDFYVFPDHRLGIGFVGLWDGANKYLHQKGIEYSCSRVSRFNLESRKAHTHLKWKRAGRAIFIKSTRRQLMLATISPFVHLSLRESSLPRVKLRSDRVLQDKPGRS